MLGALTGVHVLCNFISRGKKKVCLIFGLFGMGDNQEIAIGWLAFSSIVGTINIGRRRTFFL